MTWRLILDDGVGAAEGLAADEAMMLPYGREHPPAAPTLRLYTYRPHCALVGRYQSVEHEVDLAYCRENDVQVGRRPTGGGAILMGPLQLGVAVAARAEAGEAPREALRRWARGVQSGLAHLGLAGVALRSKNDLELDGRKIAGLGLYRDERGAELFHASVLIDLDIPLLLKILRIPGAKLSDKAVTRVEDRVTTLRRALDRPIEPEEARLAVRRGMEEAFRVSATAGELALEEAARYRSLLEERYRNREWTHQRSPRSDAEGRTVVKTPAGLLRIFVGVHGNTLKSLLVTGDFNVLPAGVAELERQLKWSRLDEDQIAAAARRLLDERELGVPAAAIAEAIWQAAQQAVASQDHSHPLRTGSCYFPDLETQPKEGALS